MMGCRVIEDMVFDRLEWKKRTQIAVNRYMRLMVIGDNYDDQLKLP